MTEFEEEEGDGNRQDMNGSEDRRSNAENEEREEHRIVEMILG